MTSPTLPSEFNIDTIIAAIASFAALLALAISIRGNTIANRALKIAQQDFDNKKPGIDIYLINTYRFESKDKHRILMFNISIINKSDAKNSAKAFLEIEYVRQDNSVARLMLNHNPELEKSIENKEFSYFPYDINLGEKESESSWLLFHEPDTFKNYRIEKYTLVVKDLLDNTKKIEANLIKTLLL
jgi:ERCC4-type nuclease